MIVPVILLLLAGEIDSKFSPVLADVSVGAHGPYQFLVDTGTDTNLIDPKLAAELSLQPTFRVELVSQSGRRIAPGTRVSTMRVGSKALPETELVFQEVPEAQRVSSGVRGVLGLRALASDFTISPSAGRLDLTDDRPSGEVVPFVRVEGRIGVKARMGRETLTLILDSGSNHVVLFRTPEAMARTAPVPATFTTFDSARKIVPTTWTAEMLLGDRVKIKTLPAAIVVRKDTPAAGLLPASIFKQVHVDQGRRELVFVR